MKKLFDLEIITWEKSSTSSQVQPLRSPVFITPEYHAYGIEQLVPTGRTYQIVKCLLICVENVMKINPNIFLLDYNDSGIVN